jgi:hypothetical protein
MAAYSALHSVGQMVVPMAEGSAEWKAGQRVYYSVDD